MTFKRFMAMALLAIFALGCTKKSSVKKSFSGYKFLKEDKVESIDSTVVQLEHEKSGAHIVLLKNQDPALSFMVGFRTPPYDDTGLFHIFEHAVLEGSRLYPSKSNFFHLANSSVASFINAMTGSVYTLYPFVTRSTKDFDNLLSVYMDAVFFPNVLEDPRIIKREGWRYEMTPEGKLGINGIVLSEMKGAFSSPYRSIWFNVSRAMVPNTPYNYSSGGLPSKVATLTFDQINDAHKKYYHPQNSVIYLYGDVDLDKTLATIDKDFLSHFEKTKDYQAPKIDTQKDFNYPKAPFKASYPGKEAPHRTFLAKGYILGEDLNPTEETAASVLMQAFIENDASPLKLRILNEGLSKTTFSIGVGGEENGIALVFEGSDEDQLKKIENVINEEFDKIIKNGMDQELLTSILNSYEFSYKEKNSNGSHKGLQLGFIVLDNWINQSQPMNEALDFVTKFKKVRTLLKDEAFIKDFFKKRLEENQKTRWIVLTPDKDFSHKFNAGLDEQVQEALKAKDLAEYKKEDDIFKEWVASKESDEILAKTPILALEDIDADEKPVEFKKEMKDQTTYLEYPQETSGISYIDLYFDLSGVERENLKNLEFFTSFIQKTDTQNYKFTKLSKEIDTYLGGLSFNFTTYQSMKNLSDFKPTLKVSLRFIDENKDKAMSLVKELLINNKFTPESRIKNLVDEMKTNMVSGISGRAPGLSMSAASKSFFPAQGAFNDETGGGVFENYIHNENISPATLIKNLKLIGEQVFNQKRLYLASITATNDELKELKSNISDLKQDLPEGASENQTWAFNDQPNYDGYAIPGEVQYVSQVTSYKEKGLEYNGSMLVYARYLNNNYMTPKLREQAGAYGGGASFSKNGLFSMSTYRDPNLSKSFDIFADAVDFMEEEKLTTDKLKPAILGSLKSYYRDKSVYEKTSTMTWLYLTDQSWDDYMQTKKEILTTKPEHIAKINEVLKKALNDSSKAVAGNAKKLKAEAGFLKKVLTIQ